MTDPLFAVMLRLAGSIDTAKSRSDGSVDEVCCLVLFPGGAVDESGDSCGGSLEGYVLG